MQPKWHFLYSFVFTYILFYFFNFTPSSLVLVFFSSIFIDLDHVLLYYLETKNLHPKRFLEWSERKKLAWEALSSAERQEYRSPHFLLHGVEFVFILVLLSFWQRFFIFILLGVIFHLFLDYIEYGFKGRKFTHLSLKTSQIWLFQRNKKRKNFISS